ncbi:MAG: hypothetical protein RR214_02270, partial [Synergistaceae bacterium]
CDFLFYCGLLSELYSLCKCAVPYMLGCPDAKILIPCPPSPDGAAQSMYCGAVAAMGENLKSEFSAYGISVELLRSSVN